MCGEQSTLRARASASLGSPPLARGTVLASKVGSLPIRITPACAGNSPQSCLRVATYHNHPRLRGEQVYHATHTLQMSGSPPLARGTAGNRRFFKPLPGITPACAGNSKCIAYKKVSLGITPACAGNSLFVLIGAYLARDHPRLRGEQYISPSQSTISLGSPPLARGTELVSTLAPLSYRITPACAGNRWIGYDSWSAT